MKLVSIMLFVVACGHGSDKAEKKATAGAGSAAAVAAKTAAVDPVAAPVTKKVLAVDALGLEVDAPGCAEVTAIDKDDQSITPSDPKCSVPFPGVVISRGAMMSALPSLDEQLKGLKAMFPTAQVAVQEKTATGWHLAFKTPTTDGSPAQANLQFYAKLGDTAFSCIGSGAYDDAKLAVLTEICASLRAKR